MLKKLMHTIILFLFILVPVYADYDPMSDEPINSYEEFYQNDENASPEFEYPSATEAAPPVHIKPTKNYAQLYNSLEPANFSYLHDIDPEQYYEMKDATWAPYPLLRLNSYIYFKNSAVEPGYYLLTPREHKGKWYLLLKQNGKVSHIIPVYDRDIVPANFYKEHIPKPKLKPSQKVHMGFLSFVGKFKSTKRKDPIKSYLEINDLENYFVSIVVYYGSHKYYTIFRTIRL